MSGFVQILFNVYQTSSFSQKENIKKNKRVFLVKDCEFTSLQIASAFSEFSFFNSTSQ